MQYSVLWMPKKILSVNARVTLSINKSSKTDPVWQHGAIKSWHVSYIKTLAC